MGPLKISRKSAKQNPKPQRKIQTEILTVLTNQPHGLRLHVLLLRQLADQPGESAARNERYGESREFIHRAGNYKTTAPSEFLQSRLDDFFV